MDQINHHPVLFSVKDLMILDKSDLVTRNGDKKTRLSVSALSIESGNLITIVGPNGAGKSSLLHCLAGGIDYSGRVIYQQKNIADARHKAPESLVVSLGVLPQLNSMEFNFSVDEVLLFGLSSRFMAVNVREFIKKIACGITGVSGFLGQSIALLSGGEQQRVHLARVIMQVLPGLCCLNPSEVFRLADELGVSNHGLSESDFTSLKNGEFPLPCLLLDEPCASLDLEFQQRIQHYLQQLCGIGLTVILVTHDLNSALYYSNRVLLMSAGEVVAFDVPERVLTPENILDVFHIHADITIHKNRRLLIF